MYVFFTSSTHRRSFLKDQENSTVTSLSITRWSCRADATKALVRNFDGIYNALTILTEDIEQKSDTRHEAAALHKNILMLENVIMAVIWNKILNRYNVSNNYLQKVGVNIVATNNLLKTLNQFTKNMRNDFHIFENEAKMLHP